MSELIVQQQLYSISISINIPIIQFFPFIQYFIFPSLMQDIFDQIQTNQSSLQSIQTDQNQFLESLSTATQVHQIVIDISNYQISSSIAQDRQMNWNCRKKNLNLLIECVNEVNNQNDLSFQQINKKKRFINLVQEKNKKNIQKIFKKEVKELLMKKQLTRIQFYKIFLEAIKFEYEKGINQDLEHNILRIKINSLKKYITSLSQEKDFLTSEFQVNQSDQKSLTRQSDKVYKQLKQTIKNIGFKIFHYGVDASHINKGTFKKIIISMIQNYLHLYKNQLVKKAHFQPFFFTLFLKHKRNLNLQNIIKLNFSNQHIAKCQIYQIMLIQEKIFEILQDFLIKAYKSYNNNPCFTVQQILKMLSKEWYLSY